MWKLQSPARTHAGYLIAYQSDGPVAPQASTVYRLFANRDECPPTNSRSYGI